MNVSYRTLQVLRHLLVEPDPQCGAEIMRALKMKSGTVYPLLARLMREDWIEPAGTLPGVNEPDAHFYRLAPAGRAAFLEMLCRLTIPDDLWREPK